MPTPSYPEHMTVRLAEGTFAAIDEIAGPGKRAAAIREAVRQWLERQRAEKDQAA